MKLATDLILASESPRRRDLLSQLGLKIRVVPSGICEKIDANVAPHNIVQDLALKKALAVSRRESTALTLGADTIVVHDGNVLGKPCDADHARMMLRRLSGTTHTVYTGIALIHPKTERQSVACEAASVTFGQLSERAIEAYVATGSPLDKAGGYGIQNDWGSVFVSRIDGDYYTVVGLPLHRLYVILRDDFPDLLIV